MDTAKSDIWAGKEASSQPAHKVLSFLPITFIFISLSPKTTATSRVMERPNEETGSVSTYTVLQEEQPSFYVVCTGRNPGIFIGPQGIQDNVESVPGALVLKRTSLADAQDTLRTALDMHCVRRVSIVYQSTLLGVQDSETMPGVNGPLSNPNNEKFYAVIIGRRPGVFCGPALVSPNTQSVPGGRSPKFETQGEAVEYMLNALHAHQVYKVVWDCNSEMLSEKDFLNELRAT